MTSPELLSISGAPKPLARVIPSTAPLALVSTFPDAVEDPPATAFEPLDSNAYTLPSESICCALR